MRGGVTILYEPGTRLPKFITYQDLNVRQDYFRLGNRLVRRVKIRSAEAFFCPGGRVDVKMPGSEFFRAAFNPLSVLSIRTLGGKTVRSNYLLCLHCGALTGKDVKTTPSEVHGRDDLDMKCQNCAREWQETV